MQGHLGIVINKDAIVRTPGGGPIASTTVITDDQTYNIARQDAQLNANNSVIIGNTAWYPMGLGGLAIPLTPGLRYELWARSTTISDILDLTWVSTNAPAALGAAVIGRALYLNQPIIIVPSLLYVYLYIRAIGSPAALDGAGFYAYLTPCTA
jgi:hypothetical protein